MQHNMRKAHIQLKAALTVATMVLWLLSPMLAVFHLITENHALDQYGHAIHTASDYRTNRLHQHTMMCIKHATQNDAHLDQQTSNDAHDDCPLAVITFNCNQPLNITQTLSMFGPLSQQDTVVASYVEQLRVTDVLAHSPKTSPPYMT